MSDVWTQGDIDTLKAAIASGVLSVKYSGPPAREVTYQSLGAMRSLLASMLAEKHAATGAAGYTVVATRKGFR